MIISILKNSPFSTRDVIELLHSSFQERKDIGLSFTCSSMTKDQFDLIMQNGITLVAYAKEDSLCGTLSAHLFTDKDRNSYGYIEYLAVEPSQKRTGIGEKLFSEMERILLSKGVSYIMSDTAARAKSSVKWHRKRGFVIVGYHSYKSTNYYSFIFRKQYSSPSLWNSIVYRTVRFVLSYLKTTIGWKRSGSERFVYRELIKLLAK